MMQTAAVPGVFLMMLLLFAGCSPGPGSSPPTSGEAGPAVVKSQGTQAATETAPPVAAGPPAATPGAPYAMELAQSAPRPLQVSAPAAKPASPRVVAAQPTVLQATPVPQPTATQSTPAPRPVATKPVPDDSPAPPPAAKASMVVDVGGLVEVAATKPGLARIGSVKCKLCHKLQFESWAKTAHAARTPPLDCESCHGPGSEYKSLAIMKDSGKAKAAGLVTPTRSFCSTCHTSGWSDDLLKRSHAHKASS